MALPLTERVFEPPLAILAALAAAEEEDLEEELAVPLLTALRGRRLLLPPLCPLVTPLWWCPFEVLPFDLR